MFPVPWRADTTGPRTVPVRSSQPRERMNEVIGRWPWVRIPCEPGRFTVRSLVHALPWSHAPQEAMGLPKKQRCDCQGEQREAERIHLGVMTIMEQIENPQSQSLPARRHNEDH